MACEGIMFPVIVWNQSEWPIWFGRYGVYIGCKHNLWEEFDFYEILATSVALLY